MQNNSGNPVKTYFGSCECGKTQIQLTLSVPLADFQPRKCDCDFCMERDIRYISDPKGYLKISSEQSLATIQQGSMQADFLSCGHCDEVICASIPVNQGSTSMIGSLNATLLSNYPLFKPAQLVSPKQLNPTEKLTRWRHVWMPITITLKS